ncbi:MAG: hypothetical protein CL920_20265 [Deltaproteobacteria bacterium]|nr:hypothetical protein [Deltaproteobacteria bacterium]MBU51027.1 hypothetical protein [Deltaproteobacteria bacterium]|tara:strand:- start:3508 stop:4236 length:729 start_codon:yes stop_codon:yes gene_type:complete
MSDIVNQTDSSLDARLQQPEVQDRLVRLLDRLDSIERSLDTIEMVAAQAPAFAAMTGDMVDEVVNRAAERGVMLEERLKNMLELLEKASSNEATHALSSLLNNTEQLEQLAMLVDQGPALFSMMTDSVDDLMGRFHDHGIDVHEFFKLGFDFLHKVSELNRTGAIEQLINSGAFNPGHVHGLRHFAEAFCKSVSNDTGQVGLFGLLGAFGDEDVQRAVGFFIRLAKEFGGRLKDSPARKQLP